MLPRFLYCCIWPKNCSFYSSLWSWLYSYLSLQPSSDGGCCRSWFSPLWTRFCLCVISRDVICCCKAGDGIAVLLVLSMQGLKRKPWMNCDDLFPEKWKLQNGSFKYFFLTRFLFSQRTVDFILYLLQQVAYLPCWNQMHVLLSAHLPRSSGRIMQTVHMCTQELLSLILGRR